jgi:hypothetical protein
MNLGSVDEQQVQRFQKGRRALPNWPPPSDSLLGKYHDYGVAADNVQCSEIGR